jgi:uncharacterized membrane protein YoaK (UPF0700 family)
LQTPEVPLSTVLDLANGDTNPKMSMEQTATLTPSSPDSPNQDDCRFQHKKPVHRRLVSHLDESLTSSKTSASILLLLTITTGIQDAISFPDYHCFASNQTGNTIFLTLAVIIPSLNGEMFVTANIAVALSFFLFGGWLTGQVGHIIANHGRKRWWLLLCNTLQTILVVVASALQYKYGVQLTSTTDLIVIALLAFSSGSQVVQSRSLSMTEIPTAMATAAWVDLMIDPHLFSGLTGNVGRNRRILFIFALVVGGFAGAAIYRFAGSANCVMASAVGKAIATLGWLVVPGKTDDVVVREKSSISQDAGEVGPERPAKEEV